MQNLAGIKIGGVKVSIVTEVKNDTHQTEYKGHHLRHPIHNARLIGVANKEVFAVAFQADFPERFGIAIYVDGVNIDQSDGIQKLEYVGRENNFYQHDGFVCRQAYQGELNYINRYNQMNGANRELAFTFNPKKSVNLNLINKESATSKIEIFLWKEGPRLQQTNRGAMRGLSLNEEKSYVGAGEATNQAYASGDDLENPQFLGTATFIHLPAHLLMHLGNRFVEKNSITKQGRIGKIDLMDVIPEV